MDPFAVSHFSDNALLHDLKALVAQDHTTTAVLLTRIAEVDDRKLYRREAYPSMHVYCIHELHFSEGAAYKHINAARAARRFPAILVAVAEGRLHLSAVVTLAAYLTAGNADELLAAATHKTRAEIELLLARRFPRPDLAERVQAIPPPPFPILPAAPPQGDQLSPGKVDASTFSPGQPALGPVCQLSPGTVEAPIARPRVTPLAPERFGPASWSASARRRDARATEARARASCALVSPASPPGRERRSDGGRAVPSGTIRRWLSSREAALIAAPPAARARCGRPA